jgi:peptidylprolyl isomerase
MRRPAAAGVALSLALALALGLAACGSSGGDDAASDATTTTAAAGTTAASGTDGPASCAPVGDIPAAEGKPTTVDAPKEPTVGDVKVTVLKEGDGPEITDASYVTVDYLGVSCSTGEQFDSSWDRGEPISIAMPGATPTATAFTVIDGWNQGLLGQKQGSLVQIDIPSDLAYGAQGSPPAIAPNDPLTFVVEVDKVSDTAPAS